MKSCLSSSLRRNSSLASQRRIPVSKSRPVYSSIVHKWIGKILGSTYRRSKGELSDCSMVILYEYTTRRAFVTASLAFFTDEQKRR